MGRRRLSEANVNTPRALPRFFVPPDWIEDREVRLQNPVSHQIQRVLRLSVGDAVCVLDRSGRAHVCILSQLNAHETVAWIESQMPLETEPAVRMTVLQGLIRAEKAEQVIRFCTQAGAEALLFAPADRSLVRWDAARCAERADRWTRIAQEEAELACRARVPQVAIFADWQDALNTLEPPCFLLDEGEGQTSLKAALQAHSRLSALSLIVGPEGGFTKAEVEHLQSRNVIPVSLGPRVLRTEAAAFYALAQLLYACEPAP